MKKLILIAVVMFSFCMHGFATNSSTEMDSIETLEEQIKDLKLQRLNIKQKLLPIQNEIKVTSKENKKLKEKLRRLPSNPLGCNFTYSDIKLLDTKIDIKTEKIANHIKKRKLILEQTTLLLNISDIGVEIDNFNFDIIQAERKALRACKSIL
jgi:peptidoglycan hydrolase CwlO-like protein